MYMFAGKPLAIPLHFRGNDTFDANQEKPRVYPFSKGLMFPSSLRAEDGLPDRRWTGQEKRSTLALGIFDSKTRYWQSMAPS